MDTTAVLVSMLQEMKKMTEANAQLLTVIQQQTELIKEQKQALNEVICLQNSLHHILQYR